MKKQKFYTKTIGVTAGQFDLMHAGHMLMFAEARKYCDYLIVLLQTDASKTPKSYRGKLKHKPYMSLKERKTLLQGVKYINEIIVYSSEEDLLNELVKLKEQYGKKLTRFIGADWSGKKFTGKSLKIKTVYNSRSHNYSTTNLIKKIQKNATKD